MSEKLRFSQLPGRYAIVRLPPDSAIPVWAMKGDLTSITRTAEELSIVCPAENLPVDVQSPLRWVCLKLEGPFPFSQTGVLLSFIRPLSENELPIFAISTFDTDYVLIMETHSARAIKILRESGHNLNN
jgi:uncharacterized protein